MANPLRLSIAKTVHLKRFLDWTGNVYGTYNKGALRSLLLSIMDKDVDYIAKIKGDIDGSVASVVSISGVGGLIIGTVIAFWVNSSSDLITSTIVIPTIILGGILGNICFNNLTFSTYHDLRYFIDTKRIKIGEYQSIINRYGSEARNMKTIGELRDYLKELSKEIPKKMKIIEKEINSLEDEQIKREETQNNLEPPPILEETSKDFSASLRETEDFFLRKFPLTLPCSSQEFHSKLIESKIKPSPLLISIKDEDIKLDSAKYNFKDLKDIYVSNLDQLKLETKLDEGTLGRILSNFTGVISINSSGNKLEKILAGQLMLREFR